MPLHQAMEVANERMAALGEFMGQFHVLEIKGERYLVEAFRHHFDPIRNPLGIIARLPKIKGDQLCSVPSSPSNSKRKRVQRVPASTKGREANAGMLSSPQKA